MSDWYWRVIALKSAFIFTCVFSYLHADDTVQKLPFCNPHSSSEAVISNDLVIVSTLDGKISAFSTQNGLKAWELDTQPLLSSNLHHVELTSGGKWVRLVPSLRGSLYSLSEDTIEPLPFDADKLLSSSFKYSEDLVIAGARETLWLGLNPNTGGVIYECGTSGCNGEQTAGDGKDVLVLRRHSNTVRAVDPRSGSEKWNFSVAEHHLALSRTGCLTPNKGDPTVGIVVGLPDGEVAINNGDGVTLWRRKLSAPVASMWRLREGSLQYVDVLWEATRSLIQNVSPSLYIGVHCNQLYIQEGPQYTQKLSSVQNTVKPVTWKMLTATPLIGSDTALTVQENKNALGLMTLYGSALQKDNHGVFLYFQETCDQAVQVSEEMIPTNEDTILPNISDDEPETNHHVHIHVYSLWFWWKEVLLIAISSALLMNLMIWPRFFSAKIRPSTPLPINQEYIVVERHYERPPAIEYSGRYENDFTPLRCLGRGGFGVVFEARNNIDHCSYAVKRITLPRRESKRERVLREVRALAKLEHEHIVRYFNAWLETPPPLWQERRDEMWMRDLDGVSVSMAEDFTSPSPMPYQPPKKGDSVMLNLNKSVDDCVDAMEFEKKMNSKRLRSLSCNDSFSIVFDENASKHPHLTTSSSPTKDKTRELVSNSKEKNASDSFIVFANSGASSHDVSVDKRLERVKHCEVNETAGSKKKKKGHTRHWSLDMCVKGNEGSSQTDTKMYLYIQMQLCLRDSLHDWLRQNRSCEDRYNRVKVLFHQIVSAVEYVHLAGLIHRDLKPSNIFFAPDGKVKVGDFGLVTAMTDISQDGEPTDEVNAYSRHTYKVGTHLYMSPEQLLGRPYSYKVDIFSLGLILFELLQPFLTESERVASLLRARNGHYPQEFIDTYPDETEVLKQMLSEDPAKRPSAAGVRARAPLYEQTDVKWHYTLPTLMAG